MHTNKKRVAAYRDGIAMFTEGEYFIAPNGETVEILYRSKDDKEKTYFVELPGLPACAHGPTVEDAINAAREKRAESTPLTDAELKEYRAENYKFSVSTFRRLTKACPSGIKTWLSERGLDMTTTMTLAEFRIAGGGQWADTLSKVVSK